MSGPYSVDLLVEGHTEPVVYETDLSDAEADRWFTKTHVGDRIFVRDIDQQLPVKEVRLRYQDQYVKIKNWKE